METATTPHRPWMNLGEIQREIERALAYRKDMGEYLHLRRVVLADLELCEISEEEAREALGALDAQYGFVGPHKEGLLSYLLHEYPDLLMNEEMEFAHAQHRIRVQNGCESACVYFRDKAHQECERCFQGDVSFSQEACPVCREELEPA